MMDENKNAFTESICEDKNIEYKKKNGLLNGKNFYIIQEIPFIDSYNYKYEQIENLNKSNKPYYLDGDTSSSYEVNDENISSKNEIKSNKSYKNENDEDESDTDKSQEHINIYQNKYNDEKKKKKKNEFLKQCEFNRDGSCYYTISNNNYLRLFATDLTLLHFLEKNENIYENLNILFEKYNNMTDLEKTKRNSSWISMKLSEHIYDCKFYPYFEWNDYNTCFFSVCSKNKPIYLYSAFDCSTLLSFKTLNECCEICNCYSLCFHPEKNWLLCGTNKSIKVFDFNKPNETLENRILSTRKGKGQKGIISVIEYKKEGYGKNCIYAVGDYNDCLYLYADNCDHKNDYILKFQNKKNSNGITHIKWFNEFFILSGSRNSPFIYLFDMRNNKNYIQKFERHALTNQKYIFDIYKDYLICGDTFGYINVYDIINNKLIHKQLINKYSPITSVNKHPIYPLLLTGSGTRRYYENNNNEVDIITNLLYNQKNFHEDSYKKSLGENDPHFPSTSNYINSVCTIFADFVTEELTS
ncbi:conserved Plasmodium protein, unknown function [Plasmodium gallinaceum]|uniref:WD repeat-containing protein 79 n=1 Tax=Plasmodium gallinaceum TaxID=5849 RepID=A0A1J1GQQ5_PLAGA|nr:conserved Plasmodium protein, unknown function [Plasmodium gallinaceum]CRG94869.1 conserved Plasmodium protein, unknown function [Plasmodium gallinaceum]